MIITKEYFSENSPPIGDTWDLQYKLLNVGCTLYSVALRCQNTPSGINVTKIIPFRILRPKIKCLNKVSSNAGQKTKLQMFYKIVLPKLHRLA